MANSSLVANRSKIIEYTMERIYLKLYELKNIFLEIFSKNKKSFSNKNNKNIINIHYN